MCRLFMRTSTPQISQSRKCLFSFFSETQENLYSGAISSNPNSSLAGYSDSSTKDSSLERRYFTNLIQDKSARDAGLQMKRQREMRRQRGIRHRRGAFVRVACGCVFCQRLSNIKGLVASQCGFISSGDSSKVLHMHLQMSRTKNAFRCSLICSMNSWKVTPLGTF